MVRVALRAAVLLLASTACGGRIAGDDVDFVVTLQANPASTFSFETKTVIDQDVSGHHATLTSVTLEVVGPNGQTLAFLADVQASATAGGQRTELVTLTGAPAVTSAPLDIQYHGDLNPFFPDGHTIVVRWTGHLDPSYGPLPAGGVQIRCRIGISS